MQRDDLNTTHSPPTPTTTSRNRWLAGLRPPLISLTFIGGLLWFVRPDTMLLVNTWTSLNPSILGCVFALAVVAALLRAWRLQGLLPANIRIGRVAGVSMLHQFYIAMLPMRSGEAALPIMLKRDGVEMVQTVAVLLVVRVLDFVVLLLCLGASTWFAWNDLPDVLRTSAPTVFGVGSAIVLGIAVAYGSRSYSVALLARALASRLTGWLPQREWLVDRLGSFHVGVNQLSRRRMLQAFMLSICIWTITCATIIPLYGPLLAIPGSAAVHIVLALLISFLTMIPIQGWAGIGTVEAISVVVLTTIDMTSEQALVTGLSLHAIQIAIVVLFGAMGLALTARAATAL